MDNNMIMIITVVICIVIYVTADKKGLLGDDTDEHGCKASAGFVWCDAQNKCIHVSDDCTVDMPGSDVDEYGCKGSAGYSWCESKNKCVGPTEKCESTDEHGCSQSEGWCDSFQQCVPLDEVDLCNKTSPPDTSADDEADDEASDEAEEEEAKDASDEPEVVDHVPAPAAPSDGNDKRVTFHDLTEWRKIMGLN